MSRRRRALLFAGAAALCGLASVALALGYRQQVDASLGETAPAVVVREALPAGKPLRPKQLSGALELRQVPLRFLPPDTLSLPEEAIGRRPLAAIPAGSYLLASQLRSGSRPERQAPKLPAGRRPLALTIAGGAAVQAAVGGRTGRVDVIVASEPRGGLRGRVEVVARGVPLIELGPSGEITDSSSEPPWSATVAVGRAEALRLIEAENYAREIRLIPR